MKKILALLIILVQLFTSGLYVNAVDSQPTVDPQQIIYQDNYSQFVDSKEPLSVIMNKDYVTDRNASMLSHPVLSKSPFYARIDYFDVPYGTDPMQKLDIFHGLGAGPRPVIFFMHGGGWSGGDKDYSRYAGPTWVALGYTVVSINYRLAPKNVYPAQVEDCAMALKWVMDNIDKYGGDPSRIAITGQSAGGQLAALLVCGEKWQKQFNLDMKNVKCWFPMCGIYDFNLQETYYHPMMFGFNNGFLDVPEKKTDASPVQYVDGNEPPCLIVHGGDDWLVPKTNATEFYAKLKEKGAPVELAIVKGYGHINLLYQYGNPGHVPTGIVNQFLAKYLPTTINTPEKYK